MMSQWLPIESAPRDEWLVGLRPQGDGYSPFFIGKKYDMRQNALLNPWTGRWAVCTHWLRLPNIPAPPQHEV